MTDAGGFPDQRKPGRAKTDRERITDLEKRVAKLEGDITRLRPPFDEGQNQEPGNPA